MTTLQFPAGVWRRYCLLSNIGFVPVVVSAFIAAENQVRPPSRIKNKKNPVGPALMLYSQFFHVGALRSLYAIDVRASERWAYFFEQVYREVNALLLVLVEVQVPFRKFIADFNDPRHSHTIPSVVYVVKGIFLFVVPACSTELTPKIGLLSRKCN